MAGIIINMQIFFLITYFIYFWRGVIFKPYSIASAEAIDHDFGIMCLAGEYWRKGKIPQDPYYFKKLDQVREGTYYPVNIFFAWLGSFMGLNNKWILYVVNLLLHSFGTIILAYYIFDKGWVGLFGALAWGFCAFHIKTTLWYTQLFFWITATVLCVKLHSIWLGVTIGMAILSGHPPYVVYTAYLIIVYSLLSGWYPVREALIAFAVGFPQIQGFWKHRKEVVHKTLKDKINIGNLPVWTFPLMFIPYRIDDFVCDIGYEEWNFYVGPLVFFFALFGRTPMLWALVIGGFILCTGKLHKYVHKIFFRWAYRLVYFSILGLIALSVEGLRSFNLVTQQLILLNILLGITLLYNRASILCYPLKAEGKRPSEIFKTPLLCYLEEVAKGFRVNNLPYPAHTGHINHIMTCGYTGGNRVASLGKFLNVPRDGVIPYNWFEWQPDSEDVDSYKIGFHIGEKPSNNPKWEQDTTFKNLWVNTNIVKSF